MYLVHSDDMGVRGFYWKFMRHRQTQMYLLSIGWPSRHAQKSTCGQEDGVEKQRETHENNSCGHEDGLRRTCGQKHLRPKAPAAKST